MKNWVGIWVIAALFLTGLSGCLKWYCCGNTVYYYKCSKGANTNYVQITGPPGNLHSMIADSLNAYMAQGYVCSYIDTTPAYSNCVQGEAHKKNAEAGGAPCLNSDNSICSAASPSECTE